MCSCSITSEHLQCLRMQHAKCSVVITKPPRRVCYIACCALLQTTGLPAPLAGDNAIPIKGSAVPNKDVRSPTPWTSLLLL